MLNLEHPSKKLLLISSSTIYGHEYLDHVEAEILELLAGIQRVVFVPFALYDRNAYLEKVKQRLQRLNIAVDGVHSASAPKQLIEGARAIFVGGGNTFRLLKALYDYDLLDSIRRTVEEGVPFIGSSAGSIVACPTLKTTKDMPSCAARGRRSRVGPRPAHSRKCASSCHSRSHL